MKLTNTLLCCLTFCCTTSTLLAAPQMELREHHRYDAEKFNAMKPAVGEFAPNIELKSLNGETVSLDSFTGKTIVVIKAGYT